MDVKPINNSKMTACNFFAAIATTPDLSDKVKTKSMKYLEKIIDSLEVDVNDLLSSTSTIKL